MTIDSYGSHSSRSLLMDNVPNGEHEASLEREVKTVNFWLECTSRAGHAHVPSPWKTTLHTCPSSVKMLATCTCVFSSAWPVLGTLTCPHLYFLSPFFPKYRWEKAFTRALHAHWEFSVVCWPPRKVLERKVHLLFLLSVIAGPTCEELH